MKTAIFAGTFDPFTNGHLSIARRALSLFDRLVIVVGVNADKADSKTQAQSKCEMIRAIFADEPRVEVEYSTGLTASVAQRHGACCLVRGVRSVADYEYERNMADANLKILGIDTVMLAADPELSYISSSLVRELERYGYDVSSLIPSSHK